VLFDIYRTYCNLHVDAWTSFRVLAVLVSVCSILQVGTAFLHFIFRSVRIGVMRGGIQRFLVFSIVSYFSCRIIAFVTRSANGMDPIPCNAVRDSVNLFPCGKM
jgi:hypothetical protein